MWLCSSINTFTFNVWQILKEQDIFSEPNNQKPGQTPTLHRNLRLPDNCVRLVINNYLVIPRLSVSVSAAPHIKT